LPTSSSTRFSAGAWSSVEYPPLAVSGQRRVSQRIAELQRGNNSFSSSTSSPTSTASASASVSVRVRPLVPAEADASPALRRPATAIEQRWSGASADVPAGALPTSLSQWVSGVRHHT
jgi:hypothetical protein